MPAGRQRASIFNPSPNPDQKNRKEDSSHDATQCWPIDTGGEKKIPGAYQGEAPKMFYWKTQELFFVVMLSPFDYAQGRLREASS